MDETYRKIWSLAKPYYQKGRVYDIPHIEWMQKEVKELVRREGLDEKLLMPIAILHDVGYSEVGEKNPNIKSKDSKRIHMAAGAKISRAILEEVEYNPSLIERIVHYISVHDNWVFGDSSPYQECREMAAFNDLDFLWATSSFEIFKTTAKSMGKTPEEFYELWLQEEKLVNRPFCCDYTKNMWISSMEKIKKSLDGIIE